MKLYRIKRKADGKYFIGLCVPVTYSWGANWTANGVFYKKIDTILRHLRDLCTEWEIGLPRENNNRYKITRLSYHPERAALYEVEVLNVDVRESETISGEKILTS